LNRADGCEPGEGDTDREVVDAGQSCALNCSGVFVAGVLKVAVQHAAPSHGWSWTTTGDTSGKLGSGSWVPRPLTVIRPVPAAPALSWIVASPSGVS